MGTGEAGKELSMHVCVAQAPAGEVNSPIKDTLSHLFLPAGTLRNDPRIFEL